MKVLWFSCTPSCYDIKTIGGWVEALEIIVRKYLPEIELGIVFEHSDEIFKVKKNNVTYYPIQAKTNTIIEKIYNRFFPSPRNKYNKLRSCYLKAIEDFNPDIIQCFGTELWHYGLLQKDVKIPFVIHIMGFWNVINMMDDIISNRGYKRLYRNFRNWKDQKITNEHMEMERETMKCCSFFMGRTEWDKKIVKYFAPNSTYFHCPEAIREQILYTEIKWKFNYNDVIKLITISNAGKLKGNEIMLRAAWILKNHFNKKIEWIYTTSKYSMQTYEKSTGITCEDVGIYPIGRLTSSQISDAICSAQMFIHPSIIDNSPNAVCEAQLIGIPVIATNSGGIPQIVEDGISGFLYPYSEPYALAFKIMELHNNEKILNEISKNERRISHDRHNPQLIANRLLHIYKEIEEKKHIIN